jgi:CRP-like cAMP-binding protein
MGALCSLCRDSRNEGGPDLTHKKPSDAFLIVHDSQLRQNWELFFFIVVTAVLIEVPFRLGFDILAWRSWLAVDIVTHLILLINMFLNSVTSYEVDGEMITDKQLIRRRYVSSFCFKVDVLCVVPLELLLGPALRFYSPLFITNKLLLLFRFLEYFSSWEKFCRWKKPSVSRIAKSTFMVLYLAHFVGCSLHMLIKYEGDRALSSFTGTTNFLDRTMASRYLRVFYWSFVTMTGYTNTHPHTELECLFCVLVTILGISLFATIIGTVGALVTNLDSSKLFFRERMDSVNDYLAYKQVPQDLTSEVRSYYRFLWTSGKGVEEHKVTDDFPPYLKTKLLVCLHRDLVAAVPLFADCVEDSAFVGEVVRHLKPRICLPNTYVLRKGEIGAEMFFVSRGELNVLDEAGAADHHYDEPQTIPSTTNRVLYSISEGGFFGEMALLHETLRTASVAARTYCDLLILSKTDFKKILAKFPNHAASVRAASEDRLHQLEVDRHAAEQQKEFAGSLEQLAGMKLDDQMQASLSDHTSVTNAISGQYTPATAEHSRDDARCIVDGMTVDSK